MIEGFFSVTVFSFTISGLLYFWFYDECSTLGTYPFKLFKAY